MKKKILISIFVTAFTLVSCGTPPPANTYITPQQINEPTIEDIAPVFETQIERVNNCDGTNPTYNVSYKTIEAQKASFEVSVGAGGLVTGTPIPTALEVQLEAKITAALAKDYGLTSEKNHDLTLDNVQGTFLEHIITWKVTRVKGLFEVIYGDGIAQVGFEKIANVELYNRTSKSLGCESNAANESTSSAVLETTPPPTLQAQSTPFPSSGLRWEQEAAQVPASGSTFSWELTAGQVLFLSGGQIRINGTYCGDDANQICILLFQATRSQTVFVEALIPKNNWYGISSTLTQDEALLDKESQFWSPPNCISGCQKATVLYFTDGQFVNKTTLTP